jgi:hypothetical protein
LRPILLCREATVARVSWVHQESDAVAQSFRLPLATRNAALRQYGDQPFQRRFAPLVAAP